MCGTQNDQNAQSCKYCGYLFEDFGTTGADTPSFSAPLQTPQEPTVYNVATSSETNPPSALPDSTPSMSSDSPLFVVSRSLIASVVPSIIYLAFVAAIGLFTLSLYAIGYLAFFFLIAFVPALFSPRKYEFFDSSLRIHKTIGGDSDIAYSDLTLYDSRTGRRPRIVLSAAGQRRSIIISGNPTNSQLGQSLSQFLEGKLKKYNPKETTEQNPQKSSQDNASDVDNDSLP